MTMRGITWLSVLVWLGAAAPAIAQEGAPASPPAESKRAPDASTERQAESVTDITWYAQALAQGPGGLNVTHFWSKGPKLRAETVIAGHKVVTIVNGDWYYAFDVALANGIQVRRASDALAKDAPYRRPFGNEALKLIRQGAELVRVETFHGREAEVYQRTDRLGRRTVWATKDALNIPLRIEMYNRTTQARQATDYTDWLTGLKLPDGFFDPPTDVNFEVYELEAYARETAKKGSVGPVPLLYMDLLRGR
jgi:hypothetical protein